MMRTEDEIQSLLARVCPEHLPFVKDEIMYTEREIKQRAKKWQMRFQLNIEMRY